MQLLASEQKGVFLVALITMQSRNGYFLYNYLVWGFGMMRRGDKYFSLADIPNLWLLFILLVLRKSKEENLLTSWDRFLENSWLSYK